MGPHGTRSLARGRATLLVLAAVCIGIGVQILRLAVVEPRADGAHVHSAEPAARSHARPDIVDTRGQIVATDVAAPSLYADPALLLDLDEVIEKLLVTLPGLDETELRKSLSDRARRFAWIRRGLAPIEAQRVHDLGLPGLAFRREPKRVYPAGNAVGHLLGQVSVDNRGIAGLERYIDETVGTDQVSGASPSRFAAVRLSLDLGVQHTVADELRQAMSRYLASGAAGLVMDISTGEIVAAVSLPSIDPNRPMEALDPSRADKLQGGVFELGSIFKAFTVAMALDEGTATLDKAYDTTRPIEIGRYTITDLHPSARPLSVRDIFIRSSNVGAGLLALESGADRQLVFLARLGLTESMRTEAGPVSPPLLPKRWDRIETVTIAYGHGLAVAPLQFAAAAASLLNGGRRVKPTLLAGAKPSGEQILKPSTSSALRELMRFNVTSASGTGRRAEAHGYEVGGKTGTAEMPGKKGYQKGAVIASFLAAFPMDAPRYLTIVSLFEPQPVAETQGATTAGVNAAPLSGRIIARIAPVLGVLPRRLELAEPVGAANSGK